MDHPRQPPTLQRSPVHLPSERPACVSTTSSSKPLPVLVRFLITHRLVQAGCCMRRRADVYIDACACPDALFDQTSACPDASARRRIRTYLHVLMRICLSRPLPVLMRFLITLRLSDIGSSWVLHASACRRIRAYLLAARRRPLTHGREGRAHEGGEGRGQEGNGEGHCHEGHECREDEGHETSKTD